MKPKLSIIIPCYNCATTLREAVDSCYKQNLALEDFEIIMVDDGSTDMTHDLMTKLAAEHSNIRTISHTENRGGGAARNSGIRASAGEVIYCLDSDNFFAPQSIRALLEFLSTQNIDGAVFHDRRFFSGTNHRKFELHQNPLTGRTITLTDIFSIQGNVLLDNFFYTRAAYLKTAGYPENHGFDTQCFELRFLAAGNRAMVCPNSIFFHRQDPGQNSYFQRVYKAGYFSRNMYLMCEDIIHLLAPTTRTLIMEFDVFQKSKLDASNLKAALDKHLIQTGTNFFTPHYETLLNTDGVANFLRSIQSSDAPEDIFTRAVLAHKNGDTGAALSHITHLLARGIDSPIIYFNLLRYTLAQIPHTRSRRCSAENCHDSYSSPPKVKSNRTLHGSTNWTYPPFISLSYL